MSLIKFHDENFNDPSFDMNVTITISSILHLLYFVHHYNDNNEKIFSDQYYSKLNIVLHVNSCSDNNTICIVRTYTKSI